jgi:hypothetical protein
MLVSSILFYQKLKNDLMQEGFVINPYDPCVANRMVNGKQHTVTWHVDDLKSSHVDSKVNDDFLQWMEKKYGGDKNNPVKATRGTRHDYLGMILDYSIPGVVQVDMAYYVKKMVDEFPESLKPAKYPWKEDLFKVDPKSPPLHRKKAETFHTFVAKMLFAVKRSRPDVGLSVAYLTTRVNCPNEDDWEKLKRTMRFLKHTQDAILYLKADSLHVLKWYIDAAFAVHPDMKSHTGAIATMGSGAIQSISTKQKINTRSSTEAELVSVDDVLSKVMWMKLFLDAQGYQVKENVIFRDNQSSMKLEVNGKSSSGKRTRHFNIKYFFITDLIERKEVTTKYCPTDHMIGDYNTKPLIGKKFDLFWNEIMGHNYKK